MSRIASINLHESAVISKLPEVAHERTVAINDLLANNSFTLVGFDGPYHLNLSVKENRLIIAASNEESKENKKITVSLKPFRQLIKDYFLICESYFEAVKAANSQSVEAIDMGRRGMHDEGAKLLSEILEENIELDFNTARRLFTLICVLHFR